MRVETTPHAEAALANILDAVPNVYGKQTVQKFHARLRLYKELLADNPYMGKKEFNIHNNANSYRSIVVHPLFKLVYRVVDEVVYIVDIWDTRRSPENLVGRLG